MVKLAINVEIKIFLIIYQNFYLLKMFAIEEAIPLERHVNFCVMRHRLRYSLNVFHCDYCEGRE